MEESVNTQGASKRQPRRIWNYTPDLPLQLAPYWDWPLKPLASARYLLRSWNPVAQRFFILVMAVVVWTWFTPDLERAETLAFGWIFEIWLRDLVILLVIAGGLHLALWKYRTQEDDYRFDMRPMARAMNDMLMQDYAILPLVDRGRVSAHSNSLGGVVLNIWDSELWNAADWYRVK